MDNKGLVTALKHVQPWQDRSLSLSSFVKFTFLLVAKYSGIFNCDIFDDGVLYFLNMYSIV
jgi:hypothetical protein